MQTKQIPLHENRCLNYTDAVVFASLLSVCLFAMLVCSSDLDNYVFIKSFIVKFDREKDVVWIVGCHYDVQQATFCNPRD